MLARRGGTSIVRTHHGLVMAAAGIDASNTDPGHAGAPPRDPDGSARRLREELARVAGVNVGGRRQRHRGRAWRTGQTDMAVGVAGIASPRRPRRAARCLRQRAGGDRSRARRRDRRCRATWRRASWRHAGRARPRARPPGAPEGRARPGRPAAGARGGRGHVRARRPRGGDGRHSWPPRPARVRRAVPTDELVAVLRATLGADDHARSARGLHVRGAPAPAARLVVRTRLPRPRLEHRGRPRPSGGLIRRPGPTNDP